MGRRKLQAVILVLVLLLAAGLRFCRLDAQSFWNDEGNSARIAERSIQLILEGAAGDIHPPLYYLALHFWRALMGQSEFALRAFSAVGGVALVALIYALGAQLFGPHTGLAAALLAAINPFQIYYSQEARSYIWVAFLGAAAAYAALRRFENLRKAGWPWSVGYVLAVTAGLYTHYLFPIILIPINLSALIHLWRRKAIKPWLHWVLLHVLAGLFYLSWAPIAIQQLAGWPSTAGGTPLWPALLEAFRLLSLGPTIETANSAIALLGFGLLLILALIPPVSCPRGIQSPLFLIVLWLLIPMALIFTLNLYKPAFLKFLLVSSPAFCLLLGQGLTRPLIPNPQSPIPLVFPLALSSGLILSFSYESLHNLYLDPTYARADYRGMAEHIQSLARPGDAVVLNAANQWEVFTYYYPHVERVYPLPRSRPVDEAKAAEELEEITAEHDRIFAIFWAEAESDPERLVERWLDTHTFKAANEWWGDVRLVTYAVPASAATEMATPLDAHLGDTIVLHGYTLLADRLAAGDIIQLSLFWETTSPLAQRHKVFLHLLDTGGALVAQRDSEPGGGLALTTTWKPGQTQIDNHGILVPAETPPGTYQLIAGLYPVGNPANRLPVTIDGEPAANFLLLHPIQIVKP